jgi:hypothetical protein
MSVFQHPHLTRGIVKTAKGSFIVKRGLVEVPDEIGEELGWQIVDTDTDFQPRLETVDTRDFEDADGSRRAAPRTASVLKGDREARARMIRAKAASRRARLDDAQSAE